MTPEAFAAFAKLTRLRSGLTSSLAVRSVLVDGLSVADAARLHSMTYAAAYEAVAAARRNLELCRAATGQPSP